MLDPRFDIRLRRRGVPTQIMDAGASRAPTDNGLLAPELAAGLARGNSARSRF
jgi:hypothetical protein